MIFFLLACFDGNVQDSALDSPCSQEPPKLEIGTGESSFESIEQGDSLVMVHGPQGGWHMLGSMYLQNTGPVVELDFKIFDYPIILISEVFKTNRERANFWIFFDFE